MCVCVLFVSSAWVVQNRVPNPFGNGGTGGFEPPCGCLETNLGVLEEQLVLLIAGPSLQFQP